MYRQSNWAAVPFDNDYSLILYWDCCNNCGLANEIHSERGTPMLLCQVHSEKVQTNPCYFTVQMMGINFESSL